MSLNIIVESMFDDVFFDQNERFQFLVINLKFFFEFFKVCRADGLKRSITMQPPHPYARIHSLADPNVSFTTSTKSKTIKPIWNENFTL